MQAGPGTASDRLDAMGRGHAALARLAEASDALEDPLVVVALADVASTGGQVDPRRSLDWLDGRHRHYGRDNALRYRWGLSWRSEPGNAAYAPEPGRPPPPAGGPLNATGSRPTRAPTGAGSWNR